MTVFLILAYLILAALGVWVYLVQTDLSARADDIERTVTALATRLAEREDPNRMIADPLTVGDDTAWDFMRHYTNNRKSCADAVREFFTRLLFDPEIEPYFRGVRMSVQEVHFTRAFKTVTKDGLKQGTINSLAKIHANIRTPDGTPITGPIYDKVIGVLVNILQEWGVPDTAIGRLAQTIAPLKAAIVAPDPDLVPDQSANA